MGLGHWLRIGSYLDLDYVYGTLSRADGEDPLDYRALMQHPAKLYVVATQVETGQGRYFTKANLYQDDYRIFMASRCVPGINQPYEIDRIKYFDGALIDPIPRKPGKDLLLVALIQRRYSNQTAPHPRGAVLLRRMEGKTVC